MKCAMGAAMATEIATTEEIGVSLCIHTNGRVVEMLAAT
jgi:hypothetical protein